MTELNVQDGVLIGEDGELYLAQGAHSILDYATGKSKVDDQSVLNFAWNVKERSAFCERRGTPFLQMVAPEKYKVQSHGWPIEGTVSFWDSHQDFTGQPVWYGADELTNNPFGRSYYKTDTHWTAAGMMLATMKIAETAGFSETEKTLLKQRMLEQTRPLGKLFYGDLGRKLTPQQGEDVDWPRLSSTLKWVENGITHEFGPAVNDGRLVCIRCSEPVTDKTVLIFGDSYLFNALRYIGLGFHNTIFCRTRFFHRELVVMSFPDVIICQAAERYTRVVSQDRKAPPYLLLPYVMGRKVEMSQEDAAFISSFLSNRREPDFAEYNVDLG